MDTVIRLFFLVAFRVCLGVMGIGIGHLGPTSAGGALCVRRAELSERFELRGWPPLIPGLIYVTIALSIAASAALAGAWPAFLIAIVLALLGSPMFLHPSSEPLLSCDAQGFRSGAYGEFSWRGHSAPKSGARPFRDKLERSRPMQTGIQNARLRAYPHIAQLRSFACS